jgi:hypothetical protein
MPEDTKQVTRRLSDAYIESFHQLELLICETERWVDSIRKYESESTNMFRRAKRIHDLLNEAANTQKFSIDELSESFQNRFIRFDEISTRSTLPLRRRFRLQNIVNCFCSVKTELPDNPISHYIHEDLEEMISKLRSIIGILELDEYLYRKIITKRANTAENNSFS